MTDAADRAATDAAAFFAGYYSTAGFAEPLSAETLSRVAGLIRAEYAPLVEAVRPFAAAAAALSANVRDDWGLWTRTSSLDPKADVSITAGDVRRAQAALRAVGGET